MKHTVFISHSSKDKAVGEEICRFLEGNGISCWIAPRDVTPGKNYGAAIVDAIDECHIFVLILTGESNKSGQVVREVERAANNNSVIIPLRVEDVQPSRDLEFYVSSSHWLDAINKPLAKHLGHLLEAIRNWEPEGGAERSSVAPAAVTAVAPSGRISNRQLTIIGGAVAVVLLCGGIIYFGFRHSTSPAQPSVISQDTPAPTPRSTSAPETAPASTTAQSTTSPTSPRPGLHPRGLFPHKSAPPPVIQQITSSSVLDPETHRGELRHYDANLAFDSDQTTSWVPKGTGIGQWIMANFKSPSRITSISIYGGYGVDARRYESNNRARSVRVTFSDGTSEILRLEDKMELQRFELQRPVLTESVKIEIMAVYRSERHDSTPISEIVFNRETD